MENKGKATRSKRLPQPFVSVTGIKIEEKYCRRCRQMKGPKEFPTAIDIFLDTDGLMSVCFECIDEIYKKFLLSEGNLERAMLKLCRLMNVAYIDEAIEATKKHIVSREEKGTNYRPFSLYMNSLVSTQKEEIGHRKKLYEADYTFKEPVHTIAPANPLTDEDYADELILFWGPNLDKDDYKFLERELDDWRKTHKSDTKAELTLLKEICFVQLEIRKERLNNKHPGALVDKLQQLMKTAAIDPSKANLASGGKSLDNFSSFIKTLEENEPASYYKDKKLFKDFDNIDWYFKKYVTRPLKNFITGSRDFNVEKDDDNDELDDFIYDEVTEDE